MSRLASEPDAEPTDERRRDDDPVADPTDVDEHVVEPNVADRATERADQPGTRRQVLGARAPMATARASVASSAAPFSWTPAAARP